MLLASQRMVPRRLLDGGFAFAAPTVEQGLRDALGR
jgi:NAD dependent epimerase/dehydratase family enzyme